MKKTINLLKGFLLIFTFIAFTSCSNDDDSPVTPPATNYITDFVTANSDYSSLLAALQKANLTGILSGTDKYTVFAPNNAAFDRFLDANGFDSLDAVPTDVLTQILLNHVVEGVVKSTDLSTGYYNTESTATPNEDKMSLYVSTDGGVTLNGISTVSGADNEVDNGIIHLVSEVIGLPTVATFAVADPNFSTLETALTTLTPATNFAGILSRTEGGNNDGYDPNFTVFAPTDAAFTAFGEVPGESLLTQVLLYHVVSGNIRSSDLTADGDTTTATLQGDNIVITLPGTNGNIANVTDAAGSTDIGIDAVDVQARNGVIHVIDKIMLPSIAD